MSSLQSLPLETTMTCRQLAELCNQLCVALKRSATLIPGRRCPLRLAAFVKSQTISRERFSTVSANRRCSCQWSYGTRGGTRFARVHRAIFWVHCS